MGIRVFGRQGEHPQVLVWGFQQNEFQTIEGLLPGAKRIFGLEDAHQAKWDLLVVRNQDLKDVGPNLYVLAFGGGIIGAAAPSGRPDEPATIVVRDLQDDPPKGQARLRSVATRFESPTEVPPAFAGLVADDLVPLLRRQGEHSILLGYTRTGDGFSAPSLEVPGVEPLIGGSDGATYAAHFRREGGKAWCLTLPDEASLAWILAAVNHWHTLDRRRFPGTLDWTNWAVKWFTPDEVAAGQRWIDGSKAVEAAKTAESALHDDFLKAREAAASGPFRLLTAGDRPLEEAVRDAFTDLGFVVREMDSERPGDDFLEDLRVSPPERPDWVALVEVKGYQRSRGKAEDLLNLTGRFGRRFRDAEGRDPDAFWYVVNHEMGVDPDARKLVLEGSDGELRSFASLGGLAIDTKDLFGLWRAVKGGTLSPEAARALMVGTTGRFAWQPPDEDSEATPSTG